jgi:hypothetical protein
MAERFYFPVEGSGTPNISPAFDAGWEQNGQAGRLILVPKFQVSVPSTIASSATKTVPITTTQDILGNQWVSGPIPAQRIQGTLSFSMRFLESATTANVTLALVVKIVDDTATARGTLFSTFNTGTEFAAALTSRGVVTQAITALTTLAGDRLVVEVGGHAAGPTAAGSYTMSLGNSSATDLATGEADVAANNPWIEFSANLFSPMPNNYQNFHGGGGVMSFGERTR